MPEEKGKSDFKFDFDTEINANGGELSILLIPVFQSDLKLNSEAPQRWFLTLPSGWTTPSLNGDLSTPLSIKIPKGEGKNQILVTLNIVICKVSECIAKKVSVIFNVIQKPNGPSNVIEEKDLLLK